ncbi:hypothetical protein HN51_028447 [Arachis hypogaea]
MEREDEDATQERRRLFCRALSSLLGSIEAAAAARACCGGMTKRESGVRKEKRDCERETESSRVKEGEEGCSRHHRRFRLDRRHHH